MRQQKESSEKDAPRDSAAMLVALGILAYAASTMTHEALGHGGSCLLAGGHTVMLAVWSETCNFPGAPRLAVKTAGPAAQFGAGLIAWLVLHLRAMKNARVRYFLWLYMVFNLFIPSSYVAFSGFTNFGDAAEVIAGHEPHMVWESGLVLLGVVVYLLAMQATALELKRFAGLDQRSGRLYHLVWIPYVSVGVFACCTAAFTPAVGRETAIEMAALSSFASGAGLFGLPDGHLRMSFLTPSETAYVTWSPAWCVAAALVVAIFFLFLGPGLR